MLAVDEIVNRIFCGHSLEILRQFPAESVHMSMTSPPYWGKRSYQTHPHIWDGDPGCEHEWSTVKGKKHIGGTDGEVSYNKDDKIHFTDESSFCAKCGAWRGELGHEPTPELYVKHLCDIFDEVKRVLKREGTCFVNIGETYYGSGGSIGHTSETKNFGRKTAEYGAFPTGTLSNKEHEFLQPKSQCCIPEMFKLGMVKRGWIARNTIIWHKPNCTPESADDRFTNDFEHIFFFVKNNNPLFWTNEKTLKLVTRPPKTSIEGIDWELQLCKKCCGTGFMADGEEEDKCQRSLEYFFEENEVKEEKQNMPCKKCSGTGKVKYTLWTGHDYYFQQQFEPYKMNRWGGKFKTNENVKTAPTEKQCGGQGSLNRMGYDCYPNPFGRNMRSVWTIKVSSFKGAHFAVYPEELITTPIKAGCPEFVCKNCGMPRVKILKSTGKYVGGNGIEYGSKTAEHIGCGPTSSLLTKQVQEKALAGYTDCGCNADFEPGIVLDLFSGSGTTPFTALKLGMRFAAIDTNPEYVKMAYGRIKPFLEQRKIANV
jgi:DNA modification methylase